MNKTITIDFQDPIYSPGSLIGKSHAEIVPGVSIRISGPDTNRTSTPTPFDLTFKVGDKAEYDSYNLRYIGTIVSVGAKTVTIDSGIREKHYHRLSLIDFIRHNKDFDLERIQRENAIESQYH